MSHAAVLKRLLPPSSYEVGAPNLSIELAADGKVLDAAFVLGASLLDEMFPGTCLATLPDWERVYGLPDECLTEAQSVTERRAALVAKDRAVGGLSLPYFRQMADDLGYTDVAMGEYRPATCSDNCDWSLWESEWRGAWHVDFADTALHVIANCGDACEGALDVYKTGPLECMILRLKPADSTVVFNYGEPS
jgi:uncharacterized protein YmfQ (DUF2313 family)